MAASSGLERPPERPNHGGGQPDGQCPRRPPPGFHPQRPELIDGDQHQRRRERGEPAPGQRIEKPLHDQPPSRPADLLLKRIHTRHPLVRVAFGIYLDYIDIVSEVTRRFQKATRGERTLRSRKRLVSGSSPSTKMEDW